MRCSTCNGPIAESEGSICDDCAEAMVEDGHPDAEEEDIGLEDDQEQYPDEDAYVDPQGETLSPKGMDQAEIRAGLRAQSLA